jgi:hypothetical protein
VKKNWLQDAMVLMAMVFMVIPCIKKRGMWLSVHGRYGPERRALPTTPPAT